MALNTRIRGQQINLDDAGIDVTADSLAFNDATDDAVKMETIDDFVTAIAGSGLANDTSTLKVDLNELDAGAVDVSADSIAIVDADDNGSKKEAIADVVTAIAGTGLAAASGVLSVDLDEVAAAVVDPTADSIVILDGDDNGDTKKESIDDLVTALAGDGIQNSSSVFAVDVSDFAGKGLKDDGSENLDLDINSLDAAAVDVANDSIAILDATDSASKKESIADLATAMAGSGITATNGVLSVDAITDNIVEADIAKENESANCNDSQTQFTLASTPVANSVQVYLNGLLQEDGSGKDYTISGTTITFTTAPATGDILIVHYIINN